MAVGRELASRRVQGLEAERHLVPAHPQRELVGQDHLHPGILQSLPSGLGDVGLNPPADLLHNGAAFDRTGKDEPAVRHSKAHVAGIVLALINHTEVGSHVAKQLDFIATIAAARIGRTGRKRHCQDHQEDLSHCTPLLDFKSHAPRQLLPHMLAVGVVALLGRSFNSRAFPDTSSKSVSSALPLSRFPAALSK